MQTTVQRLGPCGIECDILVCFKLIPFISRAVKIVYVEVEQSVFLAKGKPFADRSIENVVLNLY